MKKILFALPFGFTPQLAAISAPKKKLENTCSFYLSQVFSLFLILLVACAQANEKDDQLPTTNDKPSVRCTMEAMVCPDGTEVGRTGPNCEFAPCPTNNTNTTLTANQNISEGENMNTRVALETTMGTMVLELYDDKVPNTTANFKKLVQQGFYDGTIFHRVIKNFMIQGGDPTGTGRGGPGYMIKDEFAGLKHDKKGILSMANAGLNTGGSQFFITLVPTPWLDSKHAIFGEIAEGMDVLDKIGSTPTVGDRPKTEVKIVKARVVS